ncbi:hypothetical protein BDP27DRAFT_1427628 [Rhodocollybia butyracea]|uniref:Uncharacterized protein n=1 Tax=Rhodocollybia butyracea TaxID=206335 RepID=A0A9P5PCQ7_9AGAR|nr:hypothetical protein BDP27DRAFT_1427628 [Rhodocollybia butyracea]
MSSNFEPSPPWHRRFPASLSQSAPSLSSTSRNLIIPDSTHVSPFCYPAISPPPSKSTVSLGQSVSECSSSFQSLKMEMGWSFRTQLEQIELGRLRASDDQDVDLTLYESPEEDLDEHPIPFVPIRSKSVSSSFSSAASCSATHRPGFSSSRKSLPNPSGYANPGIIQQPCRSKHSRSKRSRVQPGSTRTRDGSGSPYIHARATHNSQHHRTTTYSSDSSSPPSPTTSSRTSSSSKYSFANILNPKPTSAKPASASTPG